MNTVYRMLRLEITPQEDGTLDVRGILSDRLQICDENGGVEGELDFVPTKRHLPLGRVVIAISISFLFLADC